MRGLESSSSLAWKDARCRIERQGQQHRSNSRGLPVHVHKQLLQDLETGGGLNVADVKAICDADMATFGPPGSTLRRTVQQRVGYLKTLSMINYVHLCSELRVPVSRNTLYDVQRVAPGLPPHKKGNPTPTRNTILRQGDTPKSTPRRPQAPRGGTRSPSKREKLTARDDMSRKYHPIPSMVAYRSKYTGRSVASRNVCASRVLTASIFDLLQLSSTTTTTFIRKNLSLMSIIPNAMEASCYSTRHATCLLLPSLVKP